MKTTFGGNRLGAGGKMTVDLKSYERSTHDLGYLWRSTMSAGTLVPFMNKVALPGDTFDIELNCDVKTHPTIGALFGSYKVQLDVFLTPMRLYNAQLHNNKLGVGLNMKTVRFPQMTFDVYPLPASVDDLDNSQVNPSCILSYLGIRGFGITSEATTRYFNAMPLLNYWDIFKNYYANKMEDNAYVIHSEIVEPVTIAGMGIRHLGTTYALLEEPDASDARVVVLGDVIILNKDVDTPNPDTILILTQEQGWQTANALSTGVWTDNGTNISSPFRQTYWGDLNFKYWRYATNADIKGGLPKLVGFALEDIDLMREKILQAPITGEFQIFPTAIPPYAYLSEITDVDSSLLYSQEGLAVKTYQSDLHNNWLQTEFIDGANGITAVTAIDTSGGSFTLDTLNLSKKVYDMLNRIAVSGGSYDDWIEAAFDHQKPNRAETPMYMGGLIKELVFQELTSTTATADQPLGTLAGRGTMAHKHKGGKIIINVDEPSYIMGIISLTPRIDYSQGNAWDTQLYTMDDLHKPALDEIGFQELSTEQLAWWDVHRNVPENKWTILSAGKQPAWINYMTSVNEVRGNFAIPNNEMFMVLNRRYEPDAGTKNIVDLTTYIDPSKFNFIFAQTALDAQNFWVQIACDITARRKMSAKIMPNL